YFNLLLDRAQMMLLDYMFLKKQKSELQIWIHIQLITVRVQSKLRGNSNVLAVGRALELKWNFISFRCKNWKNLTIALF
ncbi:hypothetical protein ACJX0J_008073, partial [Zea mays]